MQLSKYLYDFHIFFVDNVLNSKISPLCVCVCSNISVDLSSPDWFPGVQEGFSPTSVSVMCFFKFPLNCLGANTPEIPHLAAASVTKAWALSPSHNQINTCLTHSNHEMLSGCFLVVDKTQIRPRFL